MKEYDYEWEEVTRTKEVLVFGKKIIVPAWVKYVTVDHNGCVVCSMYRPVTCNKHWQPYECDDYLELGKIKMKPEYDWTTMIVEV